jgi:hypothetical protein
MQLQPDGVCGAADETTIGIGKHGSYARPGGAV